MKFIATVEDKSKIQNIVTTLKKMGVKIDNIMKITGIITGSTGNKKAEDIKIKGIKSIEIDKTMSI